MKFKPKPRMSAPLTLPAELRGQLQQSSIFTDLAQGTRIGVCACHAGAGATTISLNLAAMLAERTGAPVALVEANLRAPALSEHFNLKGEPGFSAFAAGGAAPEAFRELPGLNVHVLTAEASSNPMPTLKDAATRLPELSSQYSFVVVDLPPMLEFPDAGILATGVDGILLVLEAEETRWQVAREVRKQLETANIPLLGAVLNKKPRYVPDWLYRLL